jgi:predicted lipoprotein with Yx(FWY)xxD motif
MQMRRVMIFAATVVMAVGCTAVAVARPAAPARTAVASPTIKVASTQLGKILLTGTGYTVYEFTADRHGKEVCATRKDCLSTWPPLTATGRATAGPGVNAHLLGTIKLAHGVTQITYGGHPLYRYDLDSRGSTDYVGADQFGGDWYALTAKARAVR